MHETSELLIEASVQDIQVSVYGVSVRYTIHWSFNNQYVETKTRQKNDYVKTKNNQAPTKTSQYDLMGSVWLLRKGFHGVYNWRAQCTSSLTTCS